MLPYSQNFQGWYACTAYRKSSVCSLMNIRTWSRITLKTSHSFQTFEISKHYLDVSSLTTEAKVFERSDNITYLVSSRPYIEICRVCKIFGRRGGLIWSVPDRTSKNIGFVKSMECEADLFGQFQTLQSVAFHRFNKPDIFLCTV